MAYSPGLLLSFATNAITVNAETEAFAKLQVVPRSLGLNVADQIFHDGTRNSYGGYSAEVRMQLFVNGLSLPVAQPGPDFLLLDAPLNHAPSIASIVLQVDASERRWDVYLPDGISAKSKRVALACA